MVVVIAHGREVFTTIRHSTPCLVSTDVTVDTFFIQKVHKTGRAAARVAS
jgi:hypothetical protein